MSIANALAWGLTAAALLQGQTRQPVFRAGTKLVEVTVTVLDKKGAAVTGLRAEDFTVLDEGQRRAVALFRFDGAPESAAAEPRAAGVAPGVFSNRGDSTGARPNNITALALDSLNTPPEENIVVRAQVMRYLKALAPETRVAVFHMGQRLRILHDFTDDAASLRARIAKAVLSAPIESVSDFNRSVVEAEQFVDLFAGDAAGQKAATELMRNSLEVESMMNSGARRARMERTLAAMEALGRHMAGIPGRKSLVWIGSGFSMVSITGGMGMGPHGSVQSFEAEVRQTAQRLAQQGVVLYLVDSKGLELAPDLTASSPRPAPVRGRGRFEPQADAEAISADPFAAMKLMASVTGGRYLYNSNDLTTGFQQAVSDLRGSYTLGFYAPEEPDGKWHKLKVKTAVSGVSVRHRQGYLSEAAAPPAAGWDAEMWRAALTNPVGSSVIGVTSVCEITPAGELALTLNIDANSLHFRAEGGILTVDLQIGVADRAPDGRTETNVANLRASVPAGQWPEASTRGIPYSRQWRPAAGTATVRIVVRDVRSGQYGTLDVPLGKVPSAR